MQKRSHISIAATVLVGILAAAAGIWAAMSLRGSDAIATSKATVLQPARPLPTFDLVDHRGQAFRKSHLENRWSLVFFGFTHCPAICPNTLGLLQKANQLLADLPADERPQLVFVSVDPERDSQQAMAEYVRFFSEDMVGVTGPTDRIESFTRAMGVPVAKTPLPGGDYTVDHSAAIFLVNPQGEFNALFSTPHDANVIAQDYRTIVKAST